MEEEMVVTEDGQVILHPNPKPAIAVESPYVEDNSWNRWVDRFKKGEIIKDYKVDIDIDAHLNDLDDDDDDDYDDDDDPDWIIDEDKLVVPAPAYNEPAPYDPAPYNGVPPAEEENPYPGFVWGCPECGGQMPATAKEAHQASCAGRPWTMVEEELVDEGIFVGDAAFFSDVTEASVLQANQLLAYLAQNSSPDWLGVLDSALSRAETAAGESEYLLNVRNVNHALGRLGREHPFGAVVGGTGMAKNLAGIEGEDSQRAIRLLKQTGRLLQAGKGRGKALVVLDDTPLEPAQFVAPIAQHVGEAQFNPDDVVGVLRAAADNYDNLSNQVHELLMANDTLAKRVIGLEEELARTKEQLEKAKLEVSPGLTWQ